MASQRLLKRSTQARLASSKQADPTQSSAMTPSAPPTATPAACPRAINRLAITALLAACTASKTIVDESSARTAIAEEAAAATD